MPTDLGSGVQYEASTTGAGTGNYNSFLRLAANGDEEGFNTDDNHNADNKDGIWTHSLLVGSLQAVNIGGIDYYIVRLDLNEVQSGDNPNITLEDLRIFRSAEPADGDDFGADFAGLINVFDLGDPLDLVDTNHGSGTDDYVFYIPASLFPDPSEYFTLYANFSGSDDGFEEFRALSTVFTPQPDIGVLKETNGTDDACLNILTGEDVTWTYTVENNGNLPLSNVVVTDDNGTPGDTSDDFTATYVSGDTDLDGKLDTNETWIFSASGTAQHGEYHNIATVTGAWAFGGDSGSVSAFEEDCYVGVTPSIAIVKTTNGTDDLCPVVAVGETVTWGYTVTNTGDIGLTNVVVTDDNGTPDDTSDDFAATYVSGDTDLDGILDLTEVWQFTASGTAVEGHYDNIATVTADATDDYQNTTTVSASEDDCYIGVEGPGVRTPGFWQNPNNGGQFWDGILGNEKNAGQDCFADGDLLYSVDKDKNGSLDGKVGLLLGDWDMNGVQNDGEDTLFISLDAAKLLINASQKEVGDGRWMLGRDVVATWLNYLAGNAIGNIDADGFDDPKEAIQKAIDFLQTYGDTAGNGILASANGKSIVWEGSAIKTSSAIWQSQGADVHDDLDEYNNTGAIDGIVYAHSCDNDLFLSSMKGYAIDGFASIV